MRSKNLFYLSINSFYTCKVPLAFVFGIATTVSTVHKSLTYSGTSLVEIKLFKSYPTKVYLENVLSKVSLIYDTIRICMTGIYVID